MIMSRIFIENMNMHHIFIYIVQKGEVVLVASFNTKNIAH